MQLRNLRSPGAVDRAPPYRAHVGGEGSPRCHRRPALVQELTPRVCELVGSVVRDVCVRDDLPGRGSSLAAGASAGGFVSCLSKARGGGVGGALELFVPSHAKRASAVEPGSIEVEALAVVARLRTELLESLAPAVGHVIGRRRRRWRLR
jgi:hypothetical protein